MKKLVFITVLSLMGLAACNKDIVRDVYEGNAIDFRVALDTRGSEVTTSNLSDFFVTALTESGVSYFADESFTKDGDYFYSETDYYWPVDERLDFFAYSPAKGSLGTAELTISSETKSITDFKTADEITDQIDIVIAKASGNKEDNETTGVFLKFYHQLAQVEVRAKNENDGFVYKVNGMKIMNVASEGDLDFSVNTSWTPDYNTMTNYEVNFAAPVELGDASVSLMPAEGNNAMLIPQTTSAWDNEVEATTNTSGGSYLAVKINIVTAGESQVFPSTAGEYAWVAYPIGFVWEPGYKYIYTLDFTEGAGFVDPENNEEVDDDDPYQPGDKVLGGKMTFVSDIHSWTPSHYETINQ